MSKPDLAKPGLAPIPALEFRLLDSVAFQERREIRPGPKRYSIFDPWSILHLAQVNGDHLVMYLVGGNAVAICGDYEEVRDQILRAQGRR